MYKIASKYFMYSFTLLAVKKLLKKETKQNAPEVPSFRGILEVVHNLNGRIRFKAPALKGDETGFYELKKQLDRISSISKVETNFVTGSILIVYKEDIEPTLIVGIIIKLLGAEEKIKGVSQSRITSEFKSIEESLSLAIDEKTRGFLDLRSVMFLSLLVVGIRKMMRNPELTPPGFNYIWWAYTALNL